MSFALKKHLGKRLSTLREAKKLKQHQLGRMIGKSGKYISDVETGRIYPSSDIMEKLARALQLPISSFYFFDGIDDDAKALRKSIENLVAVNNTGRLRKFLRHMLVSLED